MNENIDNLINKFVRFKITLPELIDVAEVVNTADFKEQYELSEDVHAIIQEEGRAALNDEIKTLIEQEKKEVRRGKLLRLRDIRYQVAAACILIAFSAALFNATSGYNNENNFRKTYINK